MEPFNPYAPPVAAGGGVAVGSPSGWRIEGETLIVDKGATLPNVCLYDGTPVAGGPTQKTLTWVPQWVTILVLLSPLIYIIAYFIAKKTGAVAYYLSEEAKRRRTTGIVLLVASVVVLLAFIFIGAAMDTPAMVLVGFVAFFVLLIVGALRTKTFMLTKIDEHNLYFKLKPAAAEAFARFGR
jgi:phosphoglycerol transferase MdoB-like AlkP superfamily enzyme